MLSAVFEALTAMCAKVGVENINFNLATFIRTIVVVFILGLMVLGTRPVQNAAEISGRSYLFCCCRASATAPSGRASAHLYSATPR